MNTYHKIQTVFKRDPETNYKTLLLGEYSNPAFRYLEDNEWIFTEKVDGTNIRVMYQNNTITFGGKTDRAQIPAELVTKLNETFLPQIEKFHELFSDGPICLYGEGYGKKIQKVGGRYLPYQDFVLFDIKIGKWWLQRNDIKDVANKLGIRVVPTIGAGSLYDLVDLVSRGFNSTWGLFTAEGIVARPEVELFDKNGSRIITKLKYKDFQYDTR